MRSRNNTSYGIILYTRINGVLHFLCGKRRDTIPYIDFLLVKYELKNLKRYFSLMTKEEKHRLLNYSFDDIWNSLWLSHTCFGYVNKYHKAKQHFMQFKESGKLREYIEQTPCAYEPSWEFPKGKKINQREDEVECALREFTEETTIDRQKIELVNLKSHTNVHIGSDGKKYTTVYFVAHVKEPIYIVPERKCNLYNHSISDEFSEIRWISLAESHMYLDNGKHKIINNVEKGLSIPHLSKKSLDKIRSLVECIKTENN